jgi:hypothetical protein
MDPDPSIFVIKLQEAKITVFCSFSACYFFKVDFHHFSNEFATEGTKVFLSIFA